jgi:hypothetical protein
MLRAHQDQENLVSIHQANAATKQHGTTRTLQPKTPGARYPKTPLKIPLNDENAAHVLGGKSILTNKTKVDRAQWQTPAGKQTSEGNKLAAYMVNIDMDMDMHSLTKSGQNPGRRGQC